MTYQNFVSAASSFYDAGFLNNGDDTINKRELAAFLAQASQVRGHYMTICRRAQSIDVQHCKRRSLSQSLSLLLEGKRQSIVG